MNKPEDDKAARKVSAATVDAGGAYEETAFGRRRVGKVPRWLIALIGLVGVPFVYLYRRIRPRKPAG
jgi:hypothetical protein